MMNEVICEVGIKPRSYNQYALPILISENSE